MIQANIAEAVITADQAAAIAGVSTNTFYVWYRTDTTGKRPRKLAFSRGCVRYFRQDVLEWFAAKTGAPVATFRRT